MTRTNAITVMVQSISKRFEFSSNWKSRWNKISRKNYKAYKSDTINIDGFPYDDKKWLSSKFSGEISKDHKIHLSQYRVIFAYRKSQIVCDFDSSLSPYKEDDELKTEIESKIFLRPSYAPEMVSEFKSDFFRDSPEYAALHWRYDHRDFISEKRCAQVAERHQRDIDATLERQPRDLPPYFKFTYKLHICNPFLMTPHNLQLNLPKNWKTEL